MFSSFAQKPCQKATLATDLLFTWRFQNLAEMVIFLDFLDWKRCAQISRFEPEKCFFLRGCIFFSFPLFHKTVAFLLGQQCFLDKKNNSNNNCSWTAKLYSVFLRFLTSDEVAVCRRCKTTYQSKSYWKHYQISIGVPNWAIYHDEKCIKWRLFGRYLLPNGFASRTDSPSFHKWTQEGEASGCVEFLRALGSQSGVSVWQHTLVS